MRHLKRTAKLGRTGEHRNAMLANMVCSLIRHRRIETTLSKARAARPVAEKLVTLGKRGTQHSRRLATARLKYADRKQHASKEENARFWKNDVIRILFEEIAPAMKERAGGYTRIIKLGQRRGDAAQLAILEWVDATTVAAEPAAAADESAKAETKPESPAA